MTNSSDQIAELLGELLNRLTPTGNAKSKNKRQIETKVKHKLVVLQLIK